MQAPSEAGRAWWTRPAWVTGGLAVVVLVAITAWLAGRWTPPAAETSPSATPSAEPTPLTPGEIATLLAPSLVTITAEDSPGSESQGTGVVVADDATILTAWHVVDGGKTVHVTFADGTTTTAEVTGADEANDIVTLLPDELPSVIVPAVLGASQALAPGSEVVALGNPLGLTQSVSAGVVSGLGRSAAHPGGGELTGLIQFDAAVNPGSSGGPLVDTTGSIVGVVVALVNPTGDRTFIGIGLAVPIGTALGGAGGPQK